MTPDPALVQAAADVVEDLYGLSEKDWTNRIAAFGAAQRAEGYQSGVADAMEAGRMVLEACRAARPEGT